MQDGTVIPVQVDSQGRLVAEGLTGPAGPAGPQGEKGEKGEKGEPGAAGGLSLPPKGRDGQILGLVGGQIGWLNAAGGVDWEPVTGEIVQVIEGVQPDWSAMTAPAEKSYMFFGGAFGAEGSTCVFTPQPPLQIEGELELRNAHWRAIGDGIDRPDDGSTKGCRIYLNGVNVAYGAKRQGPFTLTSLSMTGGYYVSGGGTAENSAVAIYIDGARLMPLGPTVRLVLADATGLRDIKIGDRVRQSNGTGIGTVTGVDPAAFTVDLMGVSGAWTPLTPGTWLHGPPRPYEP